jgi:hypothetical protein
MLETVISLAMTGVLVPALMLTTITLIRGSNRTDDRSTMFRLAVAQIENILQQPFTPDPRDYPVITDIPVGYTITITGGNPVSYIYPNGTPVPQNLLQEVTVTVTGKLGQSIQLSRYKVRE